MISVSHQRPMKIDDQNSGEDKIMVRHREQTSERRIGVTFLHIAGKRLENMARRSSVGRRSMGGGIGVTFCGKEVTSSLNFLQGGFSVCMYTYIQEIFANKQTRTHPLADGLCLHCSH